MKCDCFVGFDVNGSFIVVLSRKVNGFLLILMLVVWFVLF